MSFRWELMIGNATPKKRLKVLGTPGIRKDPGNAKVREFIESS